MTARQPQAFSPVIVRTDVPGLAAPVRVVIADDSLLVLEGIRSLLRRLRAHVWRGIALESPSW
jgi:hypothetical protein